MVEVRDVYYPLGITFLALNTIGVSLRFWARGLKGAIGYDDGALVLSFVSPGFFQRDVTSTDASNRSASLSSWLWSLLQSTTASALAWTT